MLRMLEIYTVEFHPYTYTVDMHYNMFVPKFLLQSML